MSYLQKQRINCCDNLHQLRVPPPPPQGLCLLLSSVAHKMAASARPRPGVPPSCWWQWRAVPGPCLSLLDKKHYYKGVTVAAKPADINKSHLWGGLSLFPPSYLYQVIVYLFVMPWKMQHFTHVSVHKQPSCASSCTETILKGRGSR